MKRPVERKCCAFVCLGEVHGANQSLCFRRAWRRGELERGRVATCPHQRPGGRHGQMVTHLMMPVVESPSWASPSGALISKVAKIWTIAKNMHVSARYKPKLDDKRLNNVVDEQRSRHTRARARESRELSLYTVCILIHVTHRLPKPHMTFRGSISTAPFSEAMNLSGLKISGCEYVSGSCSICLM